MKFLYTFILIFSLAFQAVSASNRTDEILSEDLSESFHQLKDRKNEIYEAKKKMQELQLQLKEARKGKDTYLKIRNIAGTIAIVAIAVGSYKLTFPSGFKFTGLKLMASSYATVYGMNEGLIKLNQTDIENLSKDIVFGLIKVSKAEKSLNTEIKYFCHQDPRDELCYAVKN